MGPITLLNLFTYVSGAAGGSFNTPWVHFPSDYKEGELWVDAKLHDGGATTLTVNLQSSVDTDDSDTPATTGITGPGVTVTDVTSKLASMVRLNLTTTAASQVVLSVWLLPKRA